MKYASAVTGPVAPFSGLLVARIIGRREKTAANPVLCEYCGAWIEQAGDRWVDVRYGAGAEAKYCAVAPYAEHQPERPAFF